MGKEEEEEEEDIIYGMEIDELIAMVQKIVDNSVVTAKSQKKVERLIN